MTLIHVLYGNDPYLINEEYKEIIQKLNLLEHDLSVYDSESSNISLAIDDANVIPFISEQKVIVIKNCYFLTANRSSVKIDHDLDKLMSYVANPNPTSTLILLAPYEKLDERKNVTKTLRNNAAFKQFNKLSEQELSIWIAKNLSNHNIKITQGACDELIRRTESELLQITNELRKLVLYKEDTKKIELSDIKEIVPRNLEQNVFELVNAITAKDKEKTIEIYKDLLEAKEEPVMLLGLISNKFREIIKTKKLVEANYSNDDIAKMLHMTSGRVYYLIKAANAFNTKEVVEFIHELADIDFKIKTGMMDRFVALETFITKV